MTDRAETPAIRLARQLRDRIHDLMRQGFNMNGCVIYLGFEEIRELKAAMGNEFCLFPYEGDKRTMRFMDLPVIPVAMESYFNIHPLARRP